MFTGLIDHCSEILDVSLAPAGMQLCVATEFRDCALGESIAVNGICLTVVDAPDDNLIFDISPETLSVTNAESFAVGQKVNLERAMSASERFGGHMVLGHVDNTCQVDNITSQTTFTQIDFSGLTEEAQSFLISKGSIAVNGVSLTLNQVFEGGFSVTLIPKTLQLTNLSDIQLNDTVNVEYDYLAKVIAQQVKLYQKSSAQETSL